jgi:outer membrane protein assembly factor BamB
MRTLRAAGLGLLLVFVAAGTLYALGWRLTLDGSGAWPMLARATDFDALDADRARHRQSAPATDDPAPAAVSEDAPPGVAPAAVAPVTALPAPAAPAASPDAGRLAPVWSDFRGPARDGRATGLIRTDWPAEGLPLLWKQPIGLGYASFVAAGGRAFTIEQRRDQEIVASYDIETGREIWTNGWSGEFVETMGGDGPRATPTYHAGRIYALGALGELRSLDARSGRLIWRRNVLSDAGARNLQWGMAGAPLIVDDTVVVLPGGPGHSVVAYDRASGTPRWHALDDTPAYVSPMLVTLAGARQLLVVTAVRAVGLAPEDGRLLWEYPWPTDMGINAAQPLLLGGDRVFLSAGYGQGAAVFEVVRSGDQFTTKAIWQNTRMKNKFSSSLLHGGHIYGLDEAILACVDAATGELRWKGGRYGYGQAILSGEHLIVITEGGEVVLVRATPERHDEVARFQAIEGKTWNHPIVANGRLLVRNLREMAAFDVRPH